jgi:predicted RNA-binding protein YlqC (UPF0109 family)
MASARRLGRPILGGCLNQEGHVSEESPIDPIVEMVELIAKSLVDNPEAVAVKSVDGHQVSVLELSVDQADLGKVIGKKGRTAKSIRTLLGAAGVKHNKRFSLEILEP